jgi:hypothetical protein
MSGTFFSPRCFPSKIEPKEVSMTKATVHPDHRIISSEDVQGTDVYGVGDEVIGEIDHLLIEKVSGRVSYE